MTEVADARTVQLKNVRLSFTESLKDKKKTSDDPNAQPKHSCNLILETDKPEFEANKEKIRGALQAASEQFWKRPDMWKSLMEDDPKRVCYRKGDRFKNKDGEIYQGYEGNWAIAGAGPSAGQKRPRLLDRRKRDVSYEDILEVNYSGSYADVIVSFYGTDKGSNGIFCSIEVIRSREEGDRIGGGGWNGSIDEFDDLEEGDAFDSNNDPLG